MSGWPHTSLAYPSYRPLARIVRAGVCLLAVTCIDSTGPDPASLAFLISGGNSVAITDSIQLTAGIADVADLGAARIRWTASSSLVSFDTSGTNVVVRAGLQTGTVSVIATLTAPDVAIALADTHQINVVAGPAAQLIIVTTPATAAQAGKTLTQQPSVRLTDVGGNAVSQQGVQVLAALASDSGSVTGGSAQTDATGLATFANLAIVARIGAYRLRFITSGLAPDTSGNITLSAGDASQLAVVAQPSAIASAGLALPTQPRVQLRDLAGNDVPQAGLWLRAGVPTCTGCVITGSNGDSAQTNAAGLAIFTTLGLGGPVASYPLTFSPAGSGSALSAVTSTPIAITHGPAAQLSLVQPPNPEARSGVPLDAQPRIRILDTYDNPVTVVGTTVTATLTPGTGRLSGASAQTDATGLAAFTALAISGTVGPYDLTFTATNLPSTPATTVNVGAGAATRLVFSSQPHDTSAGAAIGGVTLEFLDASDNTVTDAAGPVSITLGSNPAGGTLSGAVAVTPLAGVAAFAGLSIDRAASGYTLAASASGVDTVYSSAFAVSAGAATQIAALSALDQSDTVGTGVEQRPAVHVTDTFGNSVPGYSVTFAVTGGGGSVTGAVQVTDASGQAAVSSWTLGTLAGPNGMSAAPTTGSLSGGPVAFSATGLPGPPALTTSQVTLTAGTVQAGAIVTARLVIRDQYTNRVIGGGAAVTFTRSGGTSTGTFGTVVDSGNGAYTAPFTGMTAGTQTFVGASIGGQAVTSTPAAVIVTTGPPVLLEILAGNSQSALVGTSLDVPPSVRVLDAGNNPLGNQTVTFQVTGGAGSVTGAAPVSGIDGVASLGSWILGLGSGPNSLNASVGAATTSFQATGTAPTLGVSQTLSVASTLSTPRAMTVDAVGDRTYVLNSNSTITVIETTTGITVNTIPISVGGFDIEVNPATQTLLLSSTFQVHRLSLPDGSYLGSNVIAPLDGASRFTIDRARSRVFAIGGLGSTGDISMVDLTTLSAVHRFTEVAMEMAVDSATGDLLVATSCAVFGACRLTRYTGATLTEIRSTGHPGGGIRGPMVIDAASRQVYILTQLGIAVLDGTTDTLITVIGPSVHPDIAGASQLLLHGPRRELTAVNTSTGMAVVIDIVTNNVVGTFSTGAATDFYLSESQNRLLVSHSSQNAVTIYNTTTRLPVDTVTNCCTSGLLAYDRIRDWVLVAGGNHVNVLSGATLAPVAAIPVSVTARRIEVDATGARAFVLGTSNQLAVVDLVQLRQVTTFALQCDARGLALDESRGSVYAVSDSQCGGSSRVSVLTRATGYATLTGGSLSSANGVDVAVDTAANVLVVLDPASGFTVIDAGTLGFLSNAPQPLYNANDVAHDPRSGHSYTYYSVPGFGFHRIGAQRTVGGSPTFVEISSPGDASAVAVLRTAHAALVAHASGITVISTDLNATVRQLSIPFGVSSLAVDEIHRRAFAMVGNVLQVVQF